MATTSTRDILDKTRPVREGEQLDLVRLEPWSAGVILPHERTLAKPKADRLALMEATGAQLSPVFGIYEDEGDMAELV